MTYFTSFPQLVYSNTLCVDITRRVKLSEETKNALSLYYIYEVDDGLRPDIIADAYYEEPTMDWLLWLTNDMVDPYYQWNLNEQEFNDFLIQKYGSVENSIEKIVYYRNNWYDDDKVLTPEFYDNTLPNNWKKYYCPFYGPNNTRILYWKRREEDWVMETNEIWKGTVSNNTFEVGDLVVMGNPSASPAIIVSTTIFNGEVEAIEDDLVFIKNVSYTVEPELLTTIAPATNTSDTKTISDIEMVYRAIPLDEGVFWSPVSYFDIENEQNTYNRSIKILDRGYLLPTLEQIRTRLNE